MRLRPLSIDGSYEIVGERRSDDRGFFGRTIDAEILRDRGLVAAYAQESISYNERRGTIRGLHYRSPPAWETKIVTCVRGRLFDVVLDLRRASPTFGRWEAIELDWQECNSLYVPAGCAHGYQTLEPQSVVLYRISPAYDPGHAAGIDPYDPTVAVHWPLEEAAVSQRDRALPSLRDFPA